MFRSSQALLTFALLCITCIPSAEGLAFLFIPKTKVATVIKKTLGHSNSNAGIKSATSLNADTVQLDEKPASQADYISEFGQDNCFRKEMLSLVYERSLQRMHTES